MRGTLLTAVNSISIVIAQAFQNVAVFNFPEGFKMRIAVYTIIVICSIAVGVSAATFVAQSFARVSTGLSTALKAAPSH